MKTFGKVVGKVVELSLVWWMGAITAEALEKYINISKEKEELENRYDETCEMLDKAQRRNYDLNKHVATLQSRFDRARNLIG